MTTTRLKYLIRGQRKSSKLIKTAVTEQKKKKINNNDSVQGGLIRADFY